MRLFLLALTLLFSQSGHAQSIVSTDVLLLINGDEIPGQVLAVSGNSISYRALTGPDTMRFDTDAVFLIRFANGTSEVLRGKWTTSQPATPQPAPDALAGLSLAQRRKLGLSDASQNYKNHSIFWISAGMGLQGGPLGIIAPTVLTSRQLTDRSLHAPVPTRLADPAYRAAYQQEARRIRRGKAWGGYVLGAAAWLFVISITSGVH